MRSQDQAQRATTPSSLPIIPAVPSLTSSPCKTRIAPAHPAGVARLRCRRCGCEIAPPRKKWCLACASTRDHWSGLRGMLGSQSRAVAGRFAHCPEERVQLEHFTITPESAWCQPGGYFSEQMSVRVPLGEGSDAA